MSNAKHGTFCRVFWPELAQIWPEVRSFPIGQGAADPGKTNGWAKYRVGVEKEIKAVISTSFCAFAERKFNLLLIFC
jgi:hypothetical protein